MELTRVNNSKDGNPRYVVHFHSLLSEDEINTLDVLEGYNFAVKRANKIGGAKYRGKDYGGGIVFQSYNTHQLIKDITNAVYNRL